jgi:hypothetical protein
MNNKKLIKLRFLKRVLNTSVLEFIFDNINFSDCNFDFKKNYKMDEIKKQINAKIPLNYLMSYILDNYTNFNDNFNFEINDFIKTIENNKLFFDDFEIVKKTEGELNNIDNIDLLFRKYYMIDNDKDYHIY